MRMKTRQRLILITKSAAQRNTARKIAEPILGGGMMRIKVS